MQRLAIVGLGHRAGKFIEEIAARHGGRVSLVGFCDLSGVRMAAQNRWLGERHGLPPVPSYPAGRFGAMLSEQRVDTVLVATVDSEHDSYIIPALKAGCRVITEKPMTIDAAKCAAILEAAARGPGRLRVAFNYRWAPANAAVKTLLRDGVVGPVRSVTLEWLLDVRHGADYFRRWHSDKASSGGLLVHKATHHFDLVNWWTDSIPDTVFASGGLMFYGRQNAIARGQLALTEYPRYTGIAQAQSDPFRLSLAENERFKALYFDAEGETGYIRDQNVFREGITIEDSLGVTVRYRGGMMLNYSLNAFSPREGMRVAFNGDRGRVEYVQFSKSNGGGDEGSAPAGAPASGEPLSSLQIFPHFGAPESIPVPTGEGGHWGGDPRMIAHLFSGGPDPLGTAAGPEQGAASILVGIAGNRSLSESRPVSLSSLVPIRPDARRLSELQ